MPLSVDVVIPVYGHWDLTERCLETLATRDACIRSVIVVDDKSPDDTAARLRERDDVVAVILEKNGGFAAACNAGARAGDADAIFFLNNDTLVPSGSIQQLATTLEGDNVAAVGPKLLYGDGTLQGVGLALLPHGTHFERVYAYLDADLSQAQVPYEPIVISGAALMVRRTAYDAAGAFDEEFINGHEDVDLALKFWAAGYRSIYEPRAEIIHLEGASRGKSLDGAVNDRLLNKRWTGRLDAMPRYKEPLPPTLDIRWNSATPLESAALLCYRAALAQHAGARVTLNRPLIARIASVLDRRERLTIEHRTPSKDAAVTWCAPETAAEAATLHAQNAQRYWVPSQRSAALLRAAGVPHANVAIARPGFGLPPEDAMRSLDRALIVRREATHASDVEPLRAALGAIPVEEIVAERAGDATVKRIFAAPLVVFADAGDAWGLLGTAALAGGAVVVARTDSPFLEIMPHDVCVVAADAAATADAVRAIVADPATYAALGPRASREMARRSPDLQIGRRIRELARAQAHGVVDTRTLAMTAAAAATMGKAN